jgi:hypothetical protein
MLLARTLLPADTALCERRTGEGRGAYCQGRCMLCGRAREHRVLAATALCAYAQRARWRVLPQALSFELAHRVRWVAPLAAAGGSARPASTVRWGSALRRAATGAERGPRARAQRKYSVAKIDTSTTYEKGRPKAGGLSDLRLGTMDRAFKCATDGANVQDCPGYFGHVELAKPMFHVGFITTIIKILRCVSYHCSKILVDKARPRPALRRRARSSTRHERPCAFTRLHMAVAYRRA